MRDSGAIRLSDLVRVVGGRQSGADVQELADACLAGQVPDRTAQERPVSTGETGYVREHRHDLVTDGAVDRVVVLAAQPVVPDPGRVRHGCVDLGLVVGRGRTIGHGSVLHSVQRIVGYRASVVALCGRGPARADSGNLPNIPGSARRRRPAGSGVRLAESGSLTPEPGTPKSATTPIPLRARPNDTDSARGSSQRHRFRTGLVPTTPIPHGARPNDTKPARGSSPGTPRRGYRSSGRSRNYLPAGLA